MMPEEWPIAAPTADRGAPVRRLGRARLSTVRRDFFLDGAERLTEQERALMGTMLACLVSAIADELRAGLPETFEPASHGANERLLERLRAAGLLDIAPLLALLLRTAEQESAMAAARNRPQRREARLLNSLVSHDNGPVAAAAMALVLARGKRRDPLGQCLISSDDLDAATLELLAQRVAAALRSEVGGQNGTGASDDALSAAADRYLERHDPESSIDALTGELIALLDGAGRLDDAFLVAAAEEGEVALLGFGLARRAGVAPGLAADSLLSGRSDLVMALLRMGGASRELAANLIAGSGGFIAFADSGQAIGEFDQMPAASVEHIRSWMRTGDAYRDAIESLERTRG